MRTAGEIAQRALVRSGVLASGETPKAAEMADALTTLGDMLDAWSTESLVVFGTTLLTLPANQESVTVGPSGTVVGARPIAFVSGYVRRDDRDVPVYQASNAYLDAASNKTASDDAHWLAFEGAMPDARFRLWPVPSSGELIVRVTTPITAIEDAADELILPPGWYQALVLSLAVHLCGEYGFAVSADLASLAQAAKATIKRVNLQPAVSVFDVAIASRGLTSFQEG